MKPAVHQREVTLASGGTVSVTVHGNVLEFSARDRALVLSLLDALDDYVRRADRADDAEAVAMGLIDLGGEG